MTRRRGGDMGIGEFFSELKSYWKHDRRDFVENLLAVFSILFALYALLILGSMEDAK